MVAYFLDSSAAAKLYVSERGSPWVARLADPAGGHELHIVRLTAVEVAAVLFRRVRAALLSARDAASALADLRRDLTQTYRLIEATPALLGLAIEVAERHDLRGYDCVQLAGALLTYQGRLAIGLSPLTLVSADAELNAAALAEGLGVEDPNSHP